MGVIVYFRKEWNLIMLCDFGHYRQLIILENKLISQTLESKE